MTRRVLLPFVRLAPARSERALANAGKPVGLTDTTIIPERPYETHLVYDLPADADPPRLYVRDAHWASVLTEFFLVGDEDGFLHARTTFDLRERTTQLGLAGTPLCDRRAGCTVGASLVSVRTDTAAGAESTKVPADGVFYVVSVRFQPRAPGVAFSPPAVHAIVRDRWGGRYGRALDVERLLPERREPSGEILTRRYVFDLPDAIEQPELVLRRRGILNRYRGEAVFPLAGG